MRIGNAFRRLVRIRDLGHNKKKRGKPVPGVCFIEQENGIRILKGKAHRSASLRLAGCFQTGQITHPGFRQGSGFDNLHEKSSFGRLDHRW